MIIYFSATGNSFWVARELSMRLSLPYFSIQEAKKIATYEMKADETCILVMPIHAWGPALPMLRFIEDLEMDFFAGHPLYAVCTCGDDCGWAHRVLRKALHQKGAELRATFSVQMPNTYILLPGFNVDTPSIERAKLEAAPTRVRRITEMIRKGGNDMHTLYHPGAFASLKTNFLYSLFRRHISGKTSFQATDACNSCGLCVRICPTRNIRMKPKNLPTWGKACVQCLACIHRCPRRAIECGHITQKKGRYVNPYIYKSST